LQISLLSRHRAETGLSRQLRRGQAFAKAVTLTPYTPAQEKQGTHTITKQYKVQNTTAAPAKEKSKQ
jgi:hypothetical protein